MKQFNYLKKVWLSFVVAMVAGVTAMAAPLSGTYTIAGTSPSYATLADAVTAVVNNGVSGPVVFNIRSGSYTGTSWYGDIGTIIGASATNTITFQPESGAGTVTITQAGSSSTNYIVRFNGCSYVTFKNLTFVNTGTSYGNIITYAGASSYDNVTGCTLTGATVTSSSSNLSTVYANGVSGANNNITGNTISGNAYALYLNGSSTTPYTSGFVFDNNTISNIYAYGVYAWYQNNFKARGNSITKTGSGTFYGMYLYYHSGAMEIRNNTITATSSVTGTVYGIYGYYLTGTYAQRQALTGNTINITTTSTIYGLSINYSNCDSISNNNITTVNSSGTTYPLYNLNSYSATSGNYMIITGNTWNCTATSSGSYSFYGNYYTLNSKFDNNNLKMISNGSGSINAYVTYYSDSFSMNNNTIYDSTGSYVYQYIGYYSNTGNLGNKGAVVKNNIRLRANSYIYNYGYYVQNVNYDSNTIYMDNNQATYSYNYLGYNNTNGTWRGNNIYMKTSYGYNYCGYYTDNAQILYNNITYIGNSNYNYNYMGYCSGSNGNTIDHNTINMTLTGSAYGYGCYLYDYSGAASIFTNNKINMSTATPGSSTAGLWWYYPNNNGVLANNAIYFSASGSSSSLLTPVAFYYPKATATTPTQVYNNTFVTYGSSSNSNMYAFYDYYYPASYPGYTIFKNNLFYNANSSGAGAFYLYTAGGFSTGSDYNNFYSTNGNLINSTATVPLLRSSTGMFNSISYDPGLVSVSTGDLHPDPTNANSWSLQGRGVQMPGNNKDLDGNNRPVTTSAGVPDIGAYEFTPTVYAPLATAVNAAVAGGTQYFTFAGDTVCSIDWATGSAVPSTGNIYVKQYTGLMPPASFLSFNGTAMYFYDSIGVNQTGTFNYAIRNYYKDPWMGTIASEAALHLAKKDVAASGPWTGYPVTVSSPNVTRNFIYTAPTPTGLGTFGYYTGMDVSNNAGIGNPMVATPTGSFCPGTYTVKINIANNGNNAINSLTVYYQINGGPIQTATISTTIPVNNGTPGSNYYLLNLGNVTFGSGAVIVKAWTSNPNGVADIVNSDDTLSQTLHAALSGIYTIGGTTPDYPNVVAAVSDLNTYGVCGPVTFNIRPGTYTGEVNLITASGMSATNRVTFQSENGVASGVTVAYNASGTGDLGVISMNKASYYSIKNISVNGLNSNYGTAVNIKGACVNDSITGCTLSCATATISSYNSPFSVDISSYAPGSNNWVFQNNTLNNGYMGMYLYANAGNMDNWLIENNTISNVYYGLYPYYNCSNFKIRYNTITAGSSNYAGIYFYNYSSPACTTEIIGNKITGFTGYPVYLYYLCGNGGSGSASLPRSKFVNNVLSSPSAYYGFMLSYTSYIDVWNNSVYCGNASNYGMYMYNYSNTGMDIRNNAFSFGSVGSYLVYNYIQNSGSYQNTMDYNNIYCPSASATWYTYYGSWTSLAAYRAGLASYNMEKNTISMNPGFTSTTNLAPNPNDPNSWSLQGRGVHIANNTTDINGNPRITLLKNGAPDIGAYEFEPTVAPPNCTAVPATATPGSKQYFLFGIDTVAVVSWRPDLLYTSPLNVKQYSGRQEAAVATLSPNRNMWFYTSLTPTATGSTYHFDIDYYYKSIWLGTIVNEPGLMVAHKPANYPVQIYANGSSGVNTSNKKLTVIDMTRFGNYTGIDTVATFSAIAYLGGSPIFCTGDSVKLLAQTSTNGWTYQWNKNGNPIPGANASIYYAKTTGDYTVTVTTLQYSATSLPITVTAVTPPMTQVAASGALIYCTGTGLQLHASPNGTSYQWQLNGTNITTNGNDSILTVTSAGTYTVTVSNIGCSRTSGTTVVSPGPLVIDLGPDIRGCEIKGQPYILDAGHPGAKYSWSTGDTTETIKIFNGKGKYAVTVDAGPGCLSSDSVNVEIDPLPTVNGISASKSSSNTYMFSPSGPQNVTSYLWIFNDQGNLTYSTDSVPPAKQYTASMIVTLIVTNNCGSDTTVLVDWATKVKNITTNDFEVSLYPNPATEKVTLSVTGGITFDEVTVMNSLGQVVIKEATGNAKAHDINVSGLASGHYMIRANTTGGIVTKPFNIIR